MSKYVKAHCIGNYADAQRQFVEQAILETAYLSLFTRDEAIDTHGHLVENYFSLWTTSLKDKEPFADAYHRIRTEAEQEAAQ